MRTIDDRPVSTTPAIVTTPLVLAALTSAGAGLVHAGAAGSHNGDSTLAVLFALAAVTQLGWAALALTRPSVAVAATGLMANAAILGVWAVTRVTEMPVIAAIGGPEAVGLQDGVAALLAAVTVGLAAWSIRSGRGPEVLRTAPVSSVVAVLVLAVCVPAVAAGHEHDHADTETGTTEALAASVETRVDEPTPEPEPEVHDHGDHDGPVTSLYDPRLTPDQRRVARTLIDDTTEAMARFPDVDAVVAEGYLSIGDGVTGFEHFVNPAYMADGIELDPERIESVVARVNPDGTREVVSAMYLLNPGSTMDDVPDLAGDLTLWHDHQDLCWEGVRVVGRVGPDGACPRGVFRGTAPMLHVWMVPHPCGPFAGLEGHGGGCAHDDH